jgi:hypothetical protein
MDGFVGKKAIAIPIAVVPGSPMNSEIALVICDHRDVPPSTSTALMDPDRSSMMCMSKGTISPV